MDAITEAYDGDIQMIDSTSVRAHQQAATAKRGVEIIVSVAPGAASRPRSTRSSTGKVGPVRISVCGRAVEHYAAMALMKRSPKMTANWALAMDHSRVGIFHSFSDRFKIR